VAAPTVTAYAGLVVPSSDAGWSQTRVGHVERVRLEAGSLIVRVRPQQPDERFLVELPDGELEVRGTTFAVSVRGGATTQVRVDEGRVELRIAGQPAFTLNANDVWPPALPIAPARAHRAPVPTTRVIAQVPHVPLGAAGGADVSRVTDDEAARYSDAVDLLRAGKYDDAANAFHVLAMGRPHATQAEDASYLEAVALARAGRFDAAALVAEHHLDSFPQSFHRKEAAILVARAARVRGDCDKARETLAPWRDAMPETEARTLLRLCFR
jgi:TolA-binding protein